MGIQIPLLVWSQFPHSEIIHTDLKVPSNFFPQQSRGPFINTFYKVVLSAFKGLCESLNTDNNTRKKRQNE